MTNEPHKTIIGFKIKGSRKTREVLWGILLLGGLVLGFGLFAAIQVKLCKDTYPTKTWKQCLRNR